MKLSGALPGNVLRQGHLLVSPNLFVLASAGPTGPASVHGVDEVQERMDPGA